MDARRNDVWGAPKKYVDDCGQDVGDLWEAHGATGARWIQTWGSPISYSNEQDEGHHRRKEWDESQNEQLPMQIIEECLPELNTIHLLSSWWPWVRGLPWNSCICGLPILQGTRTPIGVAGNCNPMQCEPSTSVHRKDRACNQTRRTRSCTRACTMDGPHCTKCWSKSRAECLQGNWEHRGRKESCWWRRQSWGTCVWSRGQIKRRSKGSRP